MPNVDRAARERLYDEYLALDEQYRELAERLRPFEVKTLNRHQHRQLWEIGNQLEAKLHELLEASFVRQATRAPDSGF